VLILALESSCDENSAAVVRDGQLLSVQTRTQTIHQQYGGVVPELAGRSHLELVDPLAMQALAEAGVSVADLDVIAATIGPGLIGALLVASSYARGLALSAQKSFRGIHHVEAHLWSAELSGGEIPVPFLVLLVSGGHTLLVLVEGLRRYRVLGSTLDDALGEAYDKVGKLMGLKFPAGADVDQIAATGNSSAFAFPLPMADDSFNFSFSGLKTAFLYRTRTLSDTERETAKADLLASFQDAALTSVAQKIEKAIKNFNPCAIVAAGGVAANSQLRSKLSALAERHRIPCRVPALRFCGDNAAMIGYLAWRLELAGVTADIDAEPRPRWPLEALTEGSVT
jgi:N6-L-threonylcarbamoyladenine synthase